MYNAKKLVQKEAIMSKALEKVEQLLKESEKVCLTERLLYYVPPMTL
jgi:hypothetical protein